MHVYYIVHIISEVGVSETIRKMGCFIRAGVHARSLIVKWKCASNVILWVFSFLFSLFSFGLGSFLLLGDSSNLLSSFSFYRHT